MYTHGRGNSATSGQPRFHTHTYALLGCRAPSLVPSCTASGFEQRAVSVVSPPRADRAGQPVAPPQQAAARPSRARVTRLQLCRAEMDQ